MPCVASGQMKGATCTFIDVVVHGGGSMMGIHVQILLCMDISSIMKMLNNFQGPLGFFTCWNRAYLMYDIVVDKRLHGVLSCS